jgi:hypothetical protein
MKWVFSTKLSRNYRVHNKTTTTTTTTTMEDATVTEPPSSDGSSSTSSAFIDRMSHRMSMIPSILQPLGAVEVEQQEVAMQSDLSIQAAEDDPEDDASVVAAAAAIIDDGAAGVVDGVLGQETEDKAPPILATPPSNSGGSRKRGVATTACATTSSSKKKKVAAQCCKGARVKVTRSNLFHVLEHDEKRESLKGYGDSRNYYYGRILSGSGKQGYNICFNDLSAPFQDVTIKHRILITFVVSGHQPPTLAKLHNLLPKPTAREPWHQSSLSRHHDGRP